ncbi:HNH endonuclease [uncultured Hyphomicrobium sp.]|jgi:hypothetical protein|uniref:HNH endonuclease n=1 Tax=uncultured Hyphomicrobium sp. TaxID=194373 RepID=UPI0025E4F34C|nr:HNH endonuclease [uncultured Hyphomicrobium sp.]
MPVCIYCLTSKPDQEFSPEHVLSRAFCGQGVNWTLTSEVCLDCNGDFSRFEAHWSRQAFEAIARNFEGPASRNDQDRFDRAQPVEIDDLYFLIKGDRLVYEAGFAYPNDHHLRPQIIDTGRGQQMIVGREADGAPFKAELEKLLRAESLDITLPMWREVRPDWLIAVVSRKRGSLTYAITDWRRQKRPSGLWLRSFPDDGFLPRYDRPDAIFTSRLALDHRGRIYLRAANIESAVRFLDLLFQPPAPIEPRPRLEPGDQTVAMTLETNLPHIFKGVLKTGFNLFCHQFGSDAARHPDFQTLRDILLRDAKDEDGRSLALRTCRFMDEETPDFPKAAGTDEHRLLLDVTPDGILRFCMRLYNHIGYYAHLGIVPPHMRSALKPRRVMVKHAAGGMSEVQSWS